MTEITLNFEKLINHHVLSLNRIKDTMDDRLNFIRLDKNERLIAFNKELFDNFKRSITNEDISAYTELGEMYKKLSAYLNINEEELLLSAGADLAIKTIFETCIEPGDHIIINSPSYAMYRVYANMFGAQISISLIKNEFLINIKNMLDLVSSKTKFMVLENPNGFIPAQPSINEIEYCACELQKKNILLVVDEAYIYVENEKSKVIPLINKYPNLIVVQTFSKAHGLAGQRFGFLVANRELMSFLNKTRPMHEITGLTAKAAIWLIENPILLKGFQEEIKLSKQYLSRELKKLKINYIHTVANFMIIYFPEDSKAGDIITKMKEKKILIRRPFSESHLKGWSRVAIGSLENSKLFIRAIKEIFNKND